MHRKLISYFTLTILLIVMIGCGSGDQAKTESPQTASQQQVTNPASGASQLANETIKNAPTEQAPSAQVSFAAVDLTGTMRESSEWIGQKPVVLNFWGTWCPPCRREIPELVRLYDEYKGKGLEIVSLAIRDTPSKVDAYSRQNGMNWTMLVADRQLSIDFKVTGVPTTIFFDKDGNIVKVKDYNGKMVDRFVGPRPYEVFKQAFEAIL